MQRFAPVLCSLALLLCLLSECALCDPPDRGQQSPVRGRGRGGRGSRGRESPWPSSDDTDGPLGGDWVLEEEVEVTGDGDFEGGGGSEDWDESGLEFGVEEASSFGVTVARTFDDVNDSPLLQYPRRVGGGPVDTATVWGTSGWVPLPPQRIRLRGNRSDMRPNEGRVEVQHDGAWSLVCDDHFGANEANVACKSLGFKNGANKWYSGSFFGTGKFKKEDIGMERVRCGAQGEETALHRCSHSHQQKCFLNSTAGVECTYNEGCDDGWIGYDGLCYKVVQTPATPENADAECTFMDASLVRLANEGENSFLSNLLYAKYNNTNAVWTAGQFVELESERGRRRRGRRAKKAWVFRSTDQAMKMGSDLWFPGFSDSSSSRPSVDLEKKSCLALSNIFYHRRSNRDTEVGYFWWDNVSCKTRLPFVCQKLATRTDCYNGTGENYMGDATRAEDGTLCQMWGEDNPDWRWRSPRPGAGRSADWGRRGRGRGGRVGRRGGMGGGRGRGMGGRGGGMGGGRGGGRGGGMGGGRGGARGGGMGGGSSSSGARDVRRFLGWRFRDHNYCRNPDREFDMPWCWVDKAKNSISFCKIPQCNSTAQTRAPEKALNGSFNSSMCRSRDQFFCPSMVNYRPSCVGKRDVCDGYRDCIGGEDENPQFCRSYHCRSNEFYCSHNHRCIPKSRVCDRYFDCDYGDDETEEACRMYPPANSTKDLMRKYSKVERIDDTSIPETMSEMVVYLTLTLAQCAGRCDKPEHMEACTGFIFTTGTEFGTQCALLSARLLGVTPGDAANSAYYEKLQTCHISTQIVCKNGQCISGSLQCNGYNDCGDFSDEIGPTACPDPRPTFEVRLSGGKGSYEGRIEAKLFKEWGLVCDDGLNASMGDVICRQLGYPLGHEELIRNARHRFRRGSGKYLMSSVNCTATSTNISNLFDCRHAGWGKAGKCGVNNVAGLVCRRQRACTRTEFRCSDRCVPLSAVCNGALDCPDGADEAVCSNTTVKLENGNGSSSGVLVVTRGGIPGAFCDDTFGPAEVQAACRQLGFSGTGRLLPPETFPTPTNLVMWTQKVNCSGPAGRPLLECGISNWGDTVCDMEEAVNIDCGAQAASTAAPRPSPSPSPSPSTKPEAAAACGKRFGSFPMGRIVNGFRATGGQFPWQVGIRIRLSASDHSQWCGGTVISDRWIVSAAHCFAGGEPKSSYILRIGDVDNAIREDSEREFDIDLLIKHPMYSGEPTFDYDIALIRINPDRQGSYIKFNNFVQPACLPEKDLVVPKGTGCHISGWGSIGDYQSTTALMAANVPLIESAKCNTMYRDRITERMQCAGFEAGGVDSCQGDSGGPLVCKVDDRYVLIGATSWGEGCAMPNAPGVYASVRNLRDWIDQTISGNQ